MIEHPKFKPTTPITEIFEAFKNPVSGVPLLQPMPSFPSNTFSSFDAIVWVHNNSESNCDPLEILENMRKWVFKMSVRAKWIWTESFFISCRKHFICHASGDFSVQVIPGFYLYHIVSQGPDYHHPLNDLEAFENEWCEVEVPWHIMKPTLSISPLSSAATTPTTSSSTEKVLDESDVAVFLRDDIEKRNLDGKIYKQSHLEIDLNNKSDRTEFGHARYHRQFIPGHAFDICVQWVRASGPIVNELVRKSV